MAGQPAPAGVYRGPCGVYAQNAVTGGGAQSGITAYATWLGQPVGYVLDYIFDAPTSWANFTNAGLYKPIAGFTNLSTWGALTGGRKMVLGVPACVGASAGSGGATWATEAAGANDANWTTLGNNLVTWGYSTAILRIGREFNGNWYNWSPALTGDTIASYVAGYQHIVTTLKACAGNSFKFMWNPALGKFTGQAGASASMDTQNWYPGSSSVDYIGLDFFDWGNYPTQSAPPYGNRSLAQQQSSFAYAQSRLDGLDSWVTFASAQGKQLAFPEWGLQQWLSSGNYAGGGDDPYYISAMTAYMNGAFLQAMWEDPGMGLFDTDAYAGRTAGLQAPDVSRSTFLFNFGAANTGSGGAPYSGSGSPGGGLPQPVTTPSQPPGTPPGPAGHGGTASPQPGTGWEIFVRSYADYTTLFCQVPTSVWTSFQAVKQLNDVGSGSVTLDMDQAWWKTAVMGNGATANEILDFECLWQITQDGVVRLEFLGETITEQLVDASEQRLVTVTGPGTAATLKWGMAAPEGFPNIILKLDGLLDNFGEIGVSGAGALNTGIWNVVNPAGSAFLTPVPQQSSPGGPGFALSAPAPSGTLTVAATPGTTLLGSTPWDATDTLISVHISPVGAGGTATNPSGNPLPYGSTLDGSELTQMYIESLKTSSYVAGFGLSAQDFYAWFTGPNGTQTKVICPAGSYDLANFAYWMITEQGGSGGGPGTFYWWTSPDGSAWTQQWSVVHSWDATSCGFFITAKYDTAGKAVILSGVNSNVTTPSYQGNLYLGDSAMGIWTDLLAKAKARGTIPFVGASFTGAADSFGNAWTDTQNVQVTNGTDLFNLLQSFCKVLNADFVMQPGFNLQVGLDISLGGSAVSLGTDRSAQVIFREGKDELAKQRTRARDKLANLIGVENSDGHEISANSASSIAQWGQREGWFQTSALVDLTSMEIAAAAFTAAADVEVLSWTLAILPNVPGRTVFANFNVGDWIGLERPDFTAVDAERVIAIAVQVDSSGVETHELTLQSYLAYLQEQFTYISTKLGGGFVNLPGTTPVAPSRFGTGQVPTWFTPAATLANLADVVGTGGHSGAPLVYNAATGQWQSATAASPVSGSALGLSVPMPGGTVSIVNGQVSVSAAAPAPALPPGGSSATPATTVTTPTGTTVTDATGTQRLVIGQQPDGTVTVVHSNGGTPGTPDTPTVVGGPGTVTVGWDGLLASAAPLLDFLYVQVHLSTTTGFTPSSGTLQGTLAIPGGFYTIGGLTAGTTYYAKLVAYNKSMVAGPASVQASGVPIAGSGAKVTIAASAPGSPTTGDLWFDSTNGYELKQWNGSSWVAYQYGTGALASGSVTASVLNAAVTARILGGITTTIAASAPGSPTAGDMWVNTTTGTLEQYSGAAWVVITFNATNAIQAGTVTATQIQAATITGTLIAANTIAAGNIAANAITTATINANAVTAAKIAANTVTAAQIAANTITAAQIAAGTITATQIAANTITAAKLAAGIVYATIVDGTTITGAQIIADGTSGQLLIYGGTPGSGNLVGSWSGVAGTDTHGNAYPAGIAASTATFSGSGISGAAISSSTFTGGTITGAAISNPALSGGSISETQITFDQVGGVLLVYSSSTTTVTLTSGTSWTAPAGSYTQGKVECWGADASGGGGDGTYGGEGGGAGAYACEPSYALTPGSVYTTQIGIGGPGVLTGSSGSDGGQTAFDGGGVIGNGGQANPSSWAGGPGGGTSGNTISHPGGNGGNGGLGTASAGGGGRAGSTGAGGNGGNGGGSPGAAGAAGSGTGGHAGGAGVAASTNGNTGGGGSGAGKGGSGTTYQTIHYDATGTASYYGTGYPGWSAGTLRNTNGSMFQGCSSGNIYVTGDQVSFANYDAVGMGLDWTGWTIDQVTITINNQHSWYNSGCYAVLGYATSGGNNYNQNAFWCDEGVTTSNVDVTSVLGSQIGTFTALIFGPSYYTSGGSTDLYNYGYFQGGAGAGSPRITITGHQGSGGSYRSGAGANGVIKVTYNSASTLIAAIGPASGTDGSSNAYAVGYTGAVQAFHPGSSPTSVEAWQTASPPSGWSGTLRYKLLAEFNMVYLDYSLTHTALGANTNVSLFTLPAAYRPASNKTLQNICSNNTTTAQVPSPSTFVGTGGGVTAYYTPTGTTGIDCHQAFPLD